MIVKAFNKEYICTKALKGENFIKLFNGNDVIVTFSHISDFKDYVIEMGEWSFEKPIDQRILELEATIEKLILDLDLKRKESAWKMK